MTEEDEIYTIGQASEKTDLPESTIRFYHREFSDYLSIERGDNNQRLFKDEDLKDLEYIRYLIKRENMSVSDVSSRLEREGPFRDSSQSPSTEEDEPSETFDEDSLDELKQSFKELTTEIQELRSIVEKQQDDVKNIREDQENILKLLDMNLQRYNELVDNLSL